MRLEQSDQSKEYIMRYSRQNKILDIINEYEVETQDKLAALLKEYDYDVTQATISRDIKELHLIKTLSSTGKYKYAAAVNMNAPISDRFVNIFRETIKSVICAGNLIVVKTLSGCANAAGEAIDSLNFPHIVGSVAGDNTLLVIIDDAEHATDVVEQLNDMLG
jgi:transcriptional regulator of arginine metabolism